MRGVYVLAVLLLICACAKMPVSTSYWEGGKKNEEDLRITYYDVEHKLRCSVSNDSTHLFVSFDTNDNTVEKWMLRNGVKLFIDTALKRSEGMYLKYPLESPFQGASKKNRGESAEAYQKADYKSLNKGFRSMPATLAWNTGKGEQVIDFLLERRLGFSAALSIDSANYITWSAAIPLNALGHSGIKEGKSFAIGIKIEPLHGSNAKKDNESMGNYGGAGYGGGGMGMGAGGMGGGMRNSAGMPNAGMRPGGVSSENQVAFWFQTKLAVKN